VKAMKQLHVLQGEGENKLSDAANVGAARELGRRVRPVSIEKFVGPSATPQEDFLAVEEPLQIRLAYKWNGTRVEKDIAITMRTPGHDAELAAGFLFSEGILRTSDDVLRIRDSCAVPSKSKDCNRVVFELSPEAKFDPQRMERHFYVSSSCGVCGKASIESIRSRVAFALPPRNVTLDSGVIHRLPETLRTFQSVFQKTGGLHAAALFDLSGQMLSVREDVGRHNAVDKLIGAEFLHGSLPLYDKLLLLSGRISFELVQKASMAAIPIIVAVGAPSSLAVETALQFNITLVGFVRGEQFNVYAGASRVRNTSGQTT
jgi:FdhD protein